MIDKLLCATDGSKASNKAVGFACDFANQLGIGLTFVVVDQVTDDRLANAPLGYNYEVISVINEQ